MNYKIYKITNIINNKIYIGLTSKTLDERLKAHFISSNKIKEVAYNSPFRRALRKYSKENWKIESIETNLNKIEANIKEKEYIQQYKSFKRDIGYNVSLGGFGGDTLTNNPNLNNIKIKISKSKIGSNNPNAKSVKLYNDYEILLFGSAEECKRYLDSIGINIASSTIKRKCNKIIINNIISNFKVCWNNV